MNGFIHSIQSFSTLDGPGIRSVVFMYGCPLRCIYCHNPDTWVAQSDDTTSPKALVEKLLRFLPYIKNGGITFSGGEPLLQSDFIYECAEILHEHNIHIAIDTSGAILNDSVKKLLGIIDMALLDIKFTNEQDYRRYTGGSLEQTMLFLAELEKRNISTWIRHVVVPGINDNSEDIISLKKLTEPFTVIKKTELLPFRKLCISKYDELKIDFPLKNSPELSEEKLLELQNISENKKIEK